MPLALVMFLSQPPADPAAAAERLCRDALDTTCEHDATGARFAAGEEQFQITIASNPHPDGIELAPRIEDPDTHARFEKHTATLTVEWIEGGDVPEFAAAYHPIARVLAEACGPQFGENAIALFAPQFDRLAPVSPDTQDRLRSPQPLLGLGIVHTQLGCLLREESVWVSVFPSRWGLVQITAVGGPNGPSTEHTDRMRDIAEHRLRTLRARLLFSLLYRPCQVMLDAHGEISVEYRNWLTGTRSHFVSENDVPLPRGGSATMR